MNKKNNKGFSLVELIVVIAVMAVLVGVLAPAYLRYVDKAKLQKDVSAVAEVVEAVKIASAEEDVANVIGTNGIYVIVKDNTTIYTGTATTANADGTIDALEKEVQATVANKIDFKSSAMEKAEVYLKVTKDPNYNISVEVTTNISDTTSDAYKDITALTEKKN